MSYVAFYSVDTDGSTTDTLATAAFVTSGSNRHVDVVVNIASSSAATAGTPTRTGDTYTKQRNDGNPTGSALIQAEFWMSTAEPVTGSQAMQIIISAARQYWGFTVGVFDDVNQTTRIRGGSVTLNPDGDGSIDNLVVSSPVVETGDTVGSYISGGASTVPTTNGGQDGTFRGSWLSGTNNGWGCMVTAAGASSLTFGFNNGGWRHVHYVASHPVGSTAPVVTIPTGYLATNNLSARTISQMRSPTPDNISVTEGTSPITLVTFTCTLGKGTMTMTASGSSAVSGNGTNAISIIGGSETDINNTLATFAFTGLEPTRENVTVAVLATDGTLNDTANLVLFNHRTSLTVVADSYADLVAMIQTAKMILPLGSTSGQVEIVAEDDDTLTDTQTITLFVPSSIGSSGGDVGQARMFHYLGLGF